MTAEAVTPAKQNTGLTYGLIGGLIMAVIHLLLYLGGTSYFLGPLNWAGALIVLVLAVLAGLQQKKANGGFLEFGEALKVSFTVFAIAFLIQTIFSYVLLNLIDPSFRDALELATLEKAEEVLRAFGMSENQIDEAMKRSMNRNSYSLLNMSLGFAINCIGCFLVSLIIAAIIKKKRPPFENTFTQ